MRFYSFKNILSNNAHYNVIFGERGNGKTYGCLKLCLERYIKHGHEFAYIRRWDDDLVAKKSGQLFAAIVEDGLVTKLTKGEWTGIFYKSRKWYLCRKNEEGETEIQENAFCYGFSINTQEHEKSVSYPRIQNIIFDEFLTRSGRGYLPDEFVLYMNTLSTIIRQRDGVQIFMLGNTVNKYSPYFNEMGLKHIDKMQQGAIDIYSYGDSGLKVAVEYCSATKGGKKSDVYFAFDNPKLNMITSGKWELDIYPHCPIKYTRTDIIFTYFIHFDSKILQAEIVSKGDNLFTFIHIKTTELKDTENDIIFDFDASPLPNYKINLLKPTDDLGRRILSFFQKGKVFYQDNEVGDIMRNYLINCKKL